MGLLWPHRPLQQQNPVLTLPSFVFGHPIGTNPGRSRTPAPLPTLYHVHPRRMHQTSFPRDTWRNVPAAVPHLQPRPSGNKPIPQSPEGVKENRGINTHWVNFPKWILMKSGGYTSPPKSTLMPKLWKTPNQIHHYMIVPTLSKLLFSDCLCHTNRKLGLASTSLQMILYTRNPCVIHSDWLGAGKHGGRGRAGESSRCDNCDKSRQSVALKNTTTQISPSLLLFFPPPKDDSLMSATCNIYSPRVSDCRAVPPSTKNAAY